MSLVQVGLDLLFDKRCLIMGFSTKPVSIAALQSTFLCRSADPSLDVLKDGLYDLFWLVKTCDFTRGGKVKAHTTKRCCHQSRACDLYPQCHHGEKGVILRKPMPLSLPRNTRVSTCTPHLNFTACLKLSTDARTHTHTHTHTRFAAQSSKRKHIFRLDWLMNRESAWRGGVLLYGLTFPRGEWSESISPGGVCMKPDAAIIKA